MKTKKVKVKGTFRISQTIEIDADLHDELVIEEENENWDVVNDNIIRYISFNDWDIDTMDIDIQFQR